MMDCESPPNISLFRVVEIDSRYVRLSWAHQYLFGSLYKFHYELDWWSQTDTGESFPAKLLLNQRSKTALLSDLHPKTRYGSKLLIRNDCGRTSLPLFLNFTTNPEKSGPILNQHMPHEIVLIILILLIWLLILWHFIQKYNKMTFVSPNVAFIHGRRYSDQKTNKTSEVGSLRRGSEVSKLSVTNKFDLLENVVSKWRSEIVLEDRAPISHRDVAFIMNQNDLSTRLSVENGRGQQDFRQKRRVSNATDIHVFKAPSTEVIPKLSTGSVRPSHSYPIFRESDRNSEVSNNPVCPTIYYTDYDLSSPPAKFTCEVDEVSEDELERCRLLAKLSGPRASNAEMLQPEGIIRRKVSEILLGKATTDIRRCSSISALVRRPRAHKSALVRRQSLFQSFRKSFRRKRSTKSQGCSLQGISSMNSFSSKWFRNPQPSIEERPSPPIDTPAETPTETPPYQKCSKISDRNVRMQTSTESYFTAADVLIQIDS